MRPFTGNDNSKEFKKTIAHGMDYAKRLQVARLQAQKALLMTTAERLRTFGFLARYKGPIGSIKKKKQQQQDIKKHAGNEGTYSQNTNEYEKLDAYRNLQEEEEKQKPKRKRVKQFNIIKPYVKKIKGQPANNEGNNVSEATDNISKIENNNVQENNSSHRPNQTSFNSSLYTQELSSQESENFNKEPFTDARSKSMEFESTNETSQNAPSPTKAENVSLPKCIQPSTNNERQEATNEMQIPQDYGSETQFRVASKQSEDTINCSQDFFLSQVGPIEQNMLQKKKVGTYSGTADVQGLNKSSLSGQANCRNVNAPCEKNKASEITVDSCMATLGETSGMGQIRATNSPIKVVEEDTANMLGSCGDFPDDTAMTEIDISIQSILQHDISNLSTSIAPTGSHSNCSDKVPLVPNSQFETPSTKEGQLVDQNCDAVVPELNIDDFDNNSYNSVDFEVEE
ncbi:hypothetical protein B7P43_G07790 [Cryptotermes secundus]|uniref:Uncharacterized protein n=3 Tax=Cryptotermes secundus TaxID=105785 RepID=A0A2J7PJI2_9NEOP|nr:hypothetical protein B7P43_G07790 [Cryptotermes secundus]